MGKTAPNIQIVEFEQSGASPLWTLIAAAQQLYKVEVDIEKIATPEDLAEAIIARLGRENDARAVILLYQLDEDPGFLVFNDAGEVIAAGYITPK